MCGMRGPNFIGVARLTLTGHIKGKTGCVDQTASVYLPFYCKLVYMQHRQFLPKITNTVP
jgi:hypothetical protein